MVVRFQIVSPASKQKTLTVRLPILLGRGAEAKFKIQHDLVSRRHCEFFTVDGLVYVRDLGSTNGTFLNDEQVPASAKTLVPPGTKMRIGGLSFLVEYDQPAAARDDSTAPVCAAAADAISGAESRVETHDDQEGDEEPDFRVEHDDSVDDHVAGPAAAADPPARVTAEVPGQEPEMAVAAAPGPTPPIDPAAPPPVAPDGPPGAAAPGGDFGFLSAEPTSGPAPPEQAPAWPSGDEAADGPDDDELEQFFKGLK